MGWVHDMDSFELPPGISNHAGTSFGAVLRSLRRARRLRQLDLAELAYMDHSIISRIETGSLLPDRGSLDLLATALKLDSASRQWFELAYGRTLLAYRGMDSHAVVSADALLSTAMEAAELSVELRSRGDSHLAAQVAHNAAEHVRSGLNGITGEHAYVKMAEQLAELRFLEAKFYLDYLPERAISGLVIPAYEQHRAIILMLPDARRNSLNRILTEGILYFDKRYGDADEVSKLLLTEEGLSASWQPEVIRATVINSGYLGDEVGVQRKERQLRRIFNETPNQLDQVFLLEGLARAQAQLNRNRAIDVLYQAWEILDDSRDAGVYSSLRYVQVVRAHLRANEQLKIANDLDLDRRAEESLLICRQLGYGRYREEIADLLDRTA
jgi:transcriptional regulator with XRE-family HTH domain